MPPFQRITEADLRTAMRDSRYWRPGHPERSAYGAWVAQGWEGLHPQDGPARGAVWVRPYVREGHEVASHWRSAPAGQGDITLVARLPIDPNTGRPIQPGQPRTPMEGGLGGGGSGGGGRSQPQPWRPPAGAQSPAAANSPLGPRAIEFPPGQIQSKYKHAADFGLPRNWNRENGARFEEALRAHIAHPDTLRIVGSYRGQPVIHYLDPGSRLNVLIGHQGSFISAWRLRERQFMNVWLRGSL